MRVILPLCLLLTASILARGGIEEEPFLDAGEAPEGLTARDWTAIRATWGARNPIDQAAYLKASNTGDTDVFGVSVAVSGDTVVVGAVQEGSMAVGVNGDQNNDGAPDSGAAYVYVRDAAGWHQQAYLKASNTDEDDNFGCSVAISEDTIVVGARGEDSNATGVDGHQGNNAARDSGAAYVFVRSGTSWSQQAYLKASNTDAWDDFGLSVAVSGETVVIGARGEDSNATGVNGDQDDDSENMAGAAYVFVRSGTSWCQQAYLKASNTCRYDRFGCAVAVSGDLLVVGASEEDSSATGVNGDQGDNSAYSAGAAYAFVRSGGSWSQEAYLKASNTDQSDHFGSSVGADGATVVVGAWAQGLGYDHSHEGAAYVFARGGGGWTQQAYLKASNAERGDLFGTSVGVSGDRILVGAWSEDSAATGVNGNQGNNSYWDSGAAYVFVREGAGWIQHAYLKASNTGRGDKFGWAAAVSGDTMVVGAQCENSSATGVNGDQGDNSFWMAGAAYVFEFCDSEQPATEAIRLGWPPNPCAFLPGRTTGPIVGAIWDPVVDHETFAPSAVVDFVGVDLVGPLNFPSPYGLVLITPPPSSQLFFALPGAPFSIRIPNDCALIGVHAWSQGGSFNGPGLELANAIDIVFGAF
jgi:hypothetical protein